MTDLSLRCAALARADGYRPGGSAASAAAFVLVETPLPWPKDVADHPLLAPLTPVAGEHGARLQAVVPEGTTPPGAVRVVVYRRPAGGLGPFVRFGRHERVVALDRLVTEVGALLDQAAADPADGNRAGEGDGDGPIDVLVCTHGRRDVCCGSDGMRTYAQLAALALPGVRLWRTSHTGGHRFAP
ncbi:MAG TPA: sucrase ferredoxin, partial [Acidimicrobiales bacterium]|nr:sucrase ferredoxin [Acidimicrobiales bacterium]